MKRKILSWLLTLCLVVGLLPTVALAGEDTTPLNEPYGQWTDTVTSAPGGYSADDEGNKISISNAEGMVWLAKQIQNNTSYAGYTIILESDIDLGSHYWISWNKTGTFSGCFDGQGYTIKNLYIEGSSSGQGLFPVIKNGGVIKNLHVENARITSSVTTMDTSGIIAFTLEDGTITNCHVSNSSITQRSGAGMIVGATIADKGGVISYCSVENCALSLSASSDIRGGGIAGELRSENIYSNCLVDGLSVSLSLSMQNKSLFVGGIAGYNLGGLVEQCCVRNISVDYSGTDGMVPVLRIGTVIGSFSSGGVSMCYAEKNDVFSCTGTNSSNADVTELTDNQFCDKSSFPALNFDEVWEIVPGSGLGLQKKTSFPALFYAENLKIEDENGVIIGGFNGNGGSVASLISVEVPLDCDSVTITASASSGASVSGVPKTISFTTETELRFTFSVTYPGEAEKEITIILTRPSQLAGSGTEDDPLIVSCLEDLETLSKNITQREIENAHISITADIDCGGASIQPVSSVKNVSGNGYTISNFAINDQYTNGTGLFQTLASGGQISKLNIASATISGAQGSGILVGTIESNAEVTNCTVTGSSFTGNIGHYSGLLFGTNKGTVSGCYCEGDTRYAASNILTGAIGGKNTGTVDSCYSNVYVTGVNSGNDKGAFVQNNTDGTIENCFWNAERIENCFSNGPASHANLTGLVTASAGVKFSVETDEEPLQVGDTAEITATYSAQSNDYYPTKLTGFTFAGDESASVEEQDVKGLNVGTATISAYVEIGEKAWLFQTFNVEVSAKSISVTMTDKSVTYDRYSKTIEAASAEGGTLPSDLTLIYSYKKANTTDDGYTNIPPSAPGTYTVKVESGNPNYTLTGTTTATLTISAPSGTTDVSQNIEVLAPDSLVYDSSAKSYTAAYEGISEWIIVYYDSDGAKLDSAPADAGDYTVTINGAGESGYASITEQFTIDKATPSLTLTSSSDSLTGGGAVTLTVDGAPDEGTVAVACGDASISVNENGGSFTATLPNETKTYTFLSPRFT